MAARWPEIGQAAEQNAAPGARPRGAQARAGSPFRAGSRKAPRDHPGGRCRWLIHSLRQRSVPLLCARARWTRGRGESHVTLAGSCPRPDGHLREQRPHPGSPRALGPAGGEQTLPGGGREPEGHSRAEMQSRRRPRRVGGVPEGRGCHPLQRPQQEGRASWRPEQALNPGRGFGFLLRSLRFGQMDSERRGGTRSASGAQTGSGRTQELLAHGKHVSWLC